MDTQGNAAARSEVAAIKVAAMEVAHNVVNRAVQTYGAAGVSEDTVLARLFAITRALQIADGPNEVHLRTIGNLELARLPQAGRRGDVPGEAGHDQPRRQGRPGHRRHPRARLRDRARPRRGRSHRRGLQPQGRVLRGRGRGDHQGDRRRRGPAGPARRASGTASSPPSTRSTPTWGASTSWSTTPASRRSRPACWSVSEGLFDKTIEVNLKGPFRLMAVAGARMAAAGGGSIVNISSIGAVRPEPARGDVRRVEERPQRAHHGVRPGVRPARAGQLRDARRVRDRHGRRTGTRSSSARSSTGSRPAGSGGPTRWSAWSSTSPATRSGYTTGAVIPVDGGRTAVY